MGDHLVSENTLFQEIIEDLIADFYEFFRWSWKINNPGNPLQSNWHIEFLCHKLQNLSRYIVAREKPRHLMTIINIPPGSSKSSIIAQAFPAWLWLHDPSLRCISSSYSETLSTKNSRLCKYIVSSDLYLYAFQDYLKKAFGAKLKLIKDTEKEWINNFNGSFIATSTGGTATGQHADYQIWDDPMSVMQGWSDAERNKAHNFYDHTMPSRVTNKGIAPTILVMQRIHHDDTTAHELSKGKKVDHIIIPAEITPNVLVRPAELGQFYIDGLMDINRLDKEALESQKKDLGNMQYAGQYQQDPTPEGGNKIGKDAFQIIDEKEIRRHIIWDLWIDGAYTDKTGNDPTGLMVAGYNKSRRVVYIKHAISKHMTITNLIRYIDEYSELMDLDLRSKAYYEPKASGHSIAQLLLEETNLSPIPIKDKIVQGGKEHRIQTAIPKIEAGSMTFVKGTWNDEVIFQMTAFPAAPHDEYVDLLGYIANHYFKRRGGIRKVN